VSTLGRDGPIAARAAVAAACGLVVAICIGVSMGWKYAPACGWIAAAVVFLIWVWPPRRRLRLRFDEQKRNNGQRPYSMSNPISTSVLHA
jgi:predicted MFS family arabinose efflux permease